MTNTRGKRKENMPIDEAADVYKNEVEEEVTKETPEKGVVTCQNLNVRKEPVIGSEILSIITKDTEVKILEDANETWYKVNIPEIATGFCMKEFIKINK